MAIRNPFNKAAGLDTLPAELRGILEDMRKERSAFEASLVQATELFRGADALGPSVEQARKAAEQLAPHLATLEGLGERIHLLDVELDAQATAAREARSLMDKTARLVAEAGTEMDALGPQLREAVGLKGELAEVLEQAAAVQALGGELRGALLRQEEIAKGAAGAASTLADAQGRFDRIAGSVDALAKTVETFAQTAADLKQITTDAPNLKRELGTLRAMAEFISQKSAALEGRRDAVERATRGAERLTELMAQVDRQYAEQQSNARFLSHLEERVHELKRLHESLLEQTEETRRRQRDLDEHSRTQREAFESARSEVQDALSGFAFERDGLAAMHKRVEELREVVGTVQQQLPALHAASAGVADAEAQAQRLEARVATLREEVDGLEAAAAALGPVREDIRRVESEARDMVRRMDGVSRPAVTALDETERRVAELNEAVTGLERRATHVEALRFGLAEMSREINSGQSALDQAVRQLDRAVGLRAETAELAGQLEHEAEAMRSRLTEAGEASGRAERQLSEFEERSRRLSEVGTRLGAFEKRFTGLLEAEEKVGRLQVMLDQRQAALGAVQDDIARLFGVADATVEKARDAAALQREIEQRRQAVEELAGRLRQLDRFAEQLDARALQFAEAERHLQLLDAHLADMKSTLGTVLEQRGFLEQVIEAAGRLAFQTVQAESLLAQLRAERGEGGSPGRPSSGGIV